MHDRILEFTSAHGLPDSAAPELQRLIDELGAPQTPAAAHRDPAAPRTPEPAAGLPLVGGRYQDLGQIGVGGMGEVRRVRDLELNRTLAMKSLHRPLVDVPVALARFLDEAQATAQLQHPNIVPVYDVGVHPDGRLWFTMKEVQGRTLLDSVTALHGGASEADPTGSHEVAFRRVVTAFLAVCRAVAYAHVRGVVHRDLTPTNVMIGDLAEVYVLDWGLAKVTGRPDLAGAGGELDLVRTARSSPGAHRTQLGRVLGTPAYMPPEQARGDVAQVNARSDVYALGAMLHTILTGRPPYGGIDPFEILGQVLAGPPESSDLLSASLPDELVAACTKAMAREPDDRFPSADVLSDEIESWLDGARRREHALDVVEQAAGAVAEALALRARADGLTAQGKALLEGVEPWHPEERKAPGWAKLDEAEAIGRAASLKALEVDQTLHAALRIAPDLPEAHLALAERYRERHAEAEAGRDRDGMARAEALMRTHLAALPETHPTRRMAATYLTGHGALTLVTDPPGAEVRLYRYVEHHRRLVPVFERSLGTTPLADVSMPMGRYLCELSREGHADVRYPVEIPRLGHWDGVRPGDADPLPVWLPPQGALGSDEVYVPAGWFLSGGDPEALNAHPERRLWCDALVFGRFPVTLAEYMAFLDDLVARDKDAEALRHAPRERAGTEGALGALLLGRDDKGRFVLRPDAEGDLWGLDWPARLVDWHGARAYARWLAGRTGRPWRLPGELEWEKAARGVDGRRFPWGDRFDPSWCSSYDSHSGRRLPCSIHRFPVDVSPYGVRGMAGNAMDWCEDTEGQVVRQVVQVPEAGDPARLEGGRTVRGGAWDLGHRGARTGTRSGVGPGSRDPSYGFRTAYRP